MAMTALLLGFMLATAAGSVIWVRWRRRERMRAILTTRLDALEGEAAHVDQTARRDWLQAVVERAPRRLQVCLDRADMDLSGRRIVIAGVVLIATALFVWRVAGPGAAAVLLLAGLAAPLAALWFIAARRMAEFLEALPYFLDAVRQMLVVGNSIQQALTKAADGAPREVQRYLQPAIRRIASGAPAPDAITVAAERVDAAELFMLATAVRTNIRFGGPLAPVLGDFAEMLRNRARVGREIAAATSETRLSAAILTALPFVAMALLAAVNYGYVSYLWTEDNGVRLLMIGGALQVGGMLTMRRLMRLDF